MTELQKIIKVFATIFAVFLSISIVGGILMAIFAILNVSSTSSVTDSSSSISSEAKQTSGSGTDAKVSYSQDFTDVDSIKLDCGINDVYIYADRSDNTVSVNLDHVSDHDKLELRNGRLYYEEGWTRGSGFQWIMDFLNNGFDHQLTSGTITIHIPKGLALRSLDMDAGTGYIRLEDIVSNSVELDAGTGYVEIVNVDFSDTSLDAGTGNISFDGRLSDKTDIDAGTGNIELNIRGKREDYSLDIDKGLGSLNIDGESSSSIKIISSSTPNRLKIDSGVGNIDINFLGADAMFDNIK